MAKVEITKTELVWPGKYNDDGTLKEVPRVNLPFQVIETVNESRATREARKAGIQENLFDVYQGKGVPDDQKSVAFEVTIQPKEKLKDEDIQALMDKIVAAVAKGCKGVLRG